MSVSAPIQFAYRCTRCYQLLVANDDEVGTYKNCPHCGQHMSVPTVTPERVSLARESGTTAASFAAPPSAVTRDETPRDAAWSDADIERELKRQMYVPPGEMLTLSTMTSTPTKRLLGWIIDNMLMAVAVVAGFLAALAMNSMGLIKLNVITQEPTAKLALDLFNVLCVIYFLAVVLCVFQWWLISTRGQSIGKLILGMRIVTDGGRYPGFLQGVVLRNWVRVLLSTVPFFALFDALFILGNSNRCIHDYIANTHVVDV